MIHFVNENTKRLVGRNNQSGIRPLVLEYDITEQLDFQLISDNNQIVDVSGLSGLTLAVGLKQNRPSYELLALSHDYTIDNNVIKFALNTYTTNWLRDITKNNTEAHIEISQQSLEGKRVLLRDYCFVWPRTWVVGLSPEEIASNDYYTKTEVDELIADIELSGYVTDEEFEEGLATKQDLITEDAMLPYDLLSGTPTIPAKTSDLYNDSGYITITTVDAEISGKAETSALVEHTSNSTIHVTAEDKTSWNAKLDADALNGYATEAYVTGTISGKADKSELPTKLSDLQNDEEFITSAYVTTAISGKADESALTAHTSDATIHVTAADKAEWSGKQNAITAEAMLDYALLSGTPTIPASASQLANDVGYQTAADVADAISGKLDSPSGGTVGQVLTKTEDGEEWADDAVFNPTFIPVQEKTLGQDTAYVVDFIGKPIQKYDTASSASGSIEVQFANIASIPEDTAPTVELQIPVSADVSTITLPSATQVIDMPESLTATSGKIAYHDIVFRAEKDMNDELVVYANYAYKFDEEEQA